MFLEFDLFFSKYYLKLQFNIFNMSKRLLLLSESFLPEVILLGLGHKGGCCLFLSYFSPLSEHYCILKFHNIFDNLLECKILHKSISLVNNFPQILLH